MFISVAVGEIWRKYALSAGEIYARLSKCGFKYLDCDMYAESADTDPATESALIRDAGLTPSLAHINARSPFEHRSEIARLIRAAGKMGIPRAVVPLGYRKDNSRAEYESANLAYLKALLDSATDAGVTLLIEHCGGWQTPHYSHASIELMRIHELLGAPKNLAFNLNISRLGTAEAQPLPEITLLGGLIQSVDAADNFGGMPLGVHAEREELGFAPGMGYIDYDRVMQGLKQISYDGAFNLRMNMPRPFEKRSAYVESPKLEYMPEDITARLYVWARHICEHMLKTCGFAYPGA